MARADEDPAFARMQDGLCKALRNLDRHTAAMQRTAQRLHTAKDVQRAKEKLSQTMEGARGDVATVHDTLGLLGKYLKINPQCRTESQRLSTDARATIQRFEETHASFWAKANAAEKTFLRSGEDDDDEEEERGEGERPGGGKQQQQQQLASRDAFEQNLHDEIMAERQREVREIASNLADIHDIFVQLNELVGEQGVKIQVMEENATSAESQTSRGVTELREAGRLAMQRKKQTFWLGIAFLVGLMVLITIFLSK